MSCNNNFSVYGAPDVQAAFAQSALSSCNTVIEHYQFVINDISSEISDPKLNASKGPVLAFLNEMLKAWEDCRDDVQRQINSL